MAEYIIRKGDVSDIPELCKIERACFSMPWSEKAFEDFFANGASKVLVAQLDGVVCAYAGMNLMFGDGEITNIGVLPEYRRRGIGMALLQALAALDGVSRLLLDVRESNTAAVSMYERCGFKVDGKRRGFYTKPKEDAVLMSLDVTMDENN